jgi:hypothetical protein
MNSEPIVQEQLPTREELIRFLARQKHSISAAYDETGEQVFLGGREAPAEDAPVKAETDRRARCAICDAPSGEVTLMKVSRETAGRAVIGLEGDEAAYVCYGGNCSAQRNLALTRLFKRLPFGVNRLTKVGHSTQWQLDSEGKPVKVYARTGRSYKQAKARKAIQKQSRKANRSN